MVAVVRGERFYLPLATVAGAVWSAVLLGVGGERGRGLSDLSDWSDLSDFVTSVFGMFPDFSFKTLSFFPHPVLHLRK